VYFIRGNEPREPNNNITRTTTTTRRTTTTSIDTTTVNGGGENNQTTRPITTRPITTTTTGATQNQITITYIANGAIISKTSDKCTLTTNNQTCTISTPLIDRPGWEIIGWSTNPNATTAQITAGANRTYNANTTLYAITRRTLTVNFNQNGATSIGSNSKECTKWNTSPTCSVTTPTITRTGWNIIGWHQTANHNSLAGVINVGTSINVSNNITYYAQTRVSYIATFNLNGSTSIGASSLTCNRWNTAANCSVIAPTITRTGWTINGWHQTANHNSSLGVMAVGSNITLTSNITYYAQTSIQYTASFQGNGATLSGVTNPSCTRWNIEANCSVTSPSIARAGWSIHGWNSSASATTATVSTTGASVNISLTGNVTLNAITSISYTASFQGNGATLSGTTNPSCIRWNQNTNCSVTSPTIARAGWTILGWNTSSTAQNATIATTGAGVSVTLTGNVTLNAITSITHTATFNLNGALGVGANSLSCTRWNEQTNCPLTAPSITAQTGWTVVGWNQDGLSTTSTWSVGTSRNISTNETWNAITFLCNVIETGSVGVAGAPWELCDNGTLLVGAGNIDWNAVNSPWDAFSNQITQIIFDSQVTVGPRLRALFRGLTEVTTIEGIENWDTSSVTTMGGLFRYTTSLTNVDVSAWDTSNVEMMYGIFRGATSLTNLDLSNWNTSSATTMYGMFREASDLIEVDMTGWDLSNVINMNSMFLGTTNLENIIGLSNWNTGNAENMGFIFSGASSLTNLDLSAWNLSSATSIDGMFQNASSLTNLGDISNWNTINVTNMDRVFRYATSLTNLDLSGWNTSNVTTMASMFAMASSINSITLGDNFIFAPNNPWLPTPSSDATFTGLWTNVGTSAPAGTLTFNGANLVIYIRNNPAAETWVWQTW